MRMGFDWINKHPEYRDRLPPDLEVTFSDKLFAGQEPKIVFSKYHGGWHVRSGHGCAAGNGVNGASTPSASSLGHPVVKTAAPGKNFALNTWLIRDPATF